MVGHERKPGRCEHRQHRKTDAGNICRGRRGPDCVGTLGHVKNLGLYRESNGKPVEGSSRYKVRFVLEMCHSGTVSKLEGGYRGNMVGAISRMEERREMTVVELV